MNRITRSTRLFLLALLVALLLFPRFASDAFVIRLAIMAGIFILLASAHNLLMKVGQLSLGPVAFYGLGAYTSAILTTRYEIPFLGALLTAGIIATIAGWLIGRLTLKMRTAYFVLVTLGFAEFFRLVALNWVDMTNGPMGITAVPPPASWFTGYNPYYYSILFLVVIVLYGLYRLEYSTIGRAMLAVRENEPLAQSVGISSYRYMMMAALISSFIIGIAGSFYAHFFQFVGPEILVFDLTITIVVMVIAGGRATLAGPVVGAVIFAVLPEMLRTAEVWRMAIYGMLLMLTMLFMPDGILPTLEGLWRRHIASRFPIGSRPVQMPQLAGAVAYAAEAVQKSPVPEEELAMRAEIREAASVAAGKPPVPSATNRIKPDPAHRERGETILTVSRLCVYFGGVKAVDHVEFDVKEGEILAVIGPNGAGKTTTLNAISRFGPVTHGEIRYRGEPITELQPHEVARRGLVRTFQHTSLFPNATTRQNLILAHSGLEPETLRDNLLRTESCVTAEREAEAVADEILKLTELAERADLTAKNLPYGNQRLLELGVALAPKPDMLLLDEPAAGMNPVEVAQLKGLIQRIRDMGITIVLVEHDMSLVMSVSDRIVVMNYGQKIAEGRPEEIYNDRQVVEAYLGKRG